MIWKNESDYFSHYSKLLSQVKVIKVYKEDKKPPLSAAGRKLTSKKQKSGTGNSVALFVKDYDHLGSVIRLLLESNFDEVIACADPNAAHKVLETQKVTHLLCEFCLGKREDEARVNGLQFAAFWRRKFDSIKRVVVFSASELEVIPKPEEVDEVILKSAGPQAIADSLLCSL